MAGLIKFKKIGELEWEAKAINFTVTSSITDYYDKKYKERYPEATVEIIIRMSGIFDEREYFYVNIKFKDEAEEAAFLILESSFERNKNG